jgi:3D (Asp-Asp-Asp) domain-containing protein
VEGSSQAPAAQTQEDGTALVASALTDDGSGLDLTDAGIEAMLQTAPPSVPTPTPEPTPVTTPTVLQAGDRVTVTVSYYYCEQVAGGYVGDGGGFCGRMRDGNPVYPGAAACDYAHFGQRFRIEGDPTGRTYTCADTGSAVHGGHRDIWFLNNREGAEWQRVVGQVAVIEILP